MTGFCGRTAANRWNLSIEHRGDPDTLAYIRQVTGDGEFRQRSETAGEKGRASATESSTYRDLAPANVVREARRGSALLVYGHLPVVRLSLRPWFEEPHLRNIVEGRNYGR